MYVIYVTSLYCIISCYSTSIFIRFCKFGAVLLLQQALENTGTCKLQHVRTCSNTKTLPTLRFYSNYCNYCNDCIVVSANLSRKHDYRMAMAHYTYGITSLVARQVRSCSHYDTVGIASSRCHSLAEKAEMGWLHLVSFLFQSLKFLKYPEKRPTKTRLQPSDMWHSLESCSGAWCAVRQSISAVAWVALPERVWHWPQLEKAWTQIPTNTVPNYQMYYVYFSCISCLKKGSTMTMLSCCCKQTYTKCIKDLSCYGTPYIRYLDMTHMTPKIAMHFIVKLWPCALTVLQWEWNSSQVAIVICVVEHNCCNTWVRSFDFQFWLRKTGSLTYIIDLDCFWIGVAMYIMLI